MRILALLFSISIIVLSSCGSGNGNKIGKYVYRDAFGTIHVERQCRKKNMPKEGLSKESQRALAIGVYFVDTIHLSECTGMTFCPDCIDDKTFEELSAIISRHPSTLPKLY